MSDKKIKVVLIEDSGLMRLIISDILRTDASIEIVDTAGNGKEGLEKVLQHKPDVVVTDLIMPDYDGVYAVKNIMEQAPSPIIVLSSLDKADPEVFDALHEGALDFIDKPKGKAVSGIREINNQLINAVKAATQANVQPNRKIHKSGKQAFARSKHLGYEAICIGSSTGGPGAIEKIITKLPESLAIPVIIAQHMPENFLETFAKRLNGLTSLQVKLAEKGEAITGNTVYILPGHSNTQIVAQPYTLAPVFGFTNKTFKEFNCPSVDCLLLSAAQVYKQKLMGIILTGMGKDGTEGMKAVHEAGGYTISQDEASSVVYGMPKSVAEAGVAIRTLSLDDIPAFIISCL